MTACERCLNEICRTEFDIVQWVDFDYSVLRSIPRTPERGKHKISYPECFIMLDTETSKHHPDQYVEKIARFNTVVTRKRIYEPRTNYIVKWSIAINVLGVNLVCLYGSRPSECVECLGKIKAHLRANSMIVYVHNLAYDYVFLRKFFFASWGYPEEQLATKPHYPIMIRFGNRIEIRDSLILAQRSIEKWGKDLDVQHQKALGKWDYNMIRNQADPLSDDELQYISNDVICGVECLSETRRILHKTFSGMPYTATGIPRSEARERGKEFNAHREYVKMMGDFEWYSIAEWCYHGGYTHANRNIIGFVEHDVECYDFSSSYPYVMLSEKFPSERFSRGTIDLTIEDIQESSNAFMLDIEFYDIKLKDYWNPMPNMQVSKCLKLVNAVIDNGRILEADYVRIIFTEVDLEIILKQYEYYDVRIRAWWMAAKDYLPRWFTDYIYECYKEKTQLKGVDPVQYNIAKAKLNALYGMTVQKVIQDDIKESYISGEYDIIDKRDPDQYQHDIKIRTKYLPYAWGVYVTAYAMRNLYRLGMCVDEWLYSDTDSIYGIGWNRQHIDQYNDFCKKILKSLGFVGIEHEGKIYYPGVAELDGRYNEFKTLGAKRYCCRDANTGKLKITVAGVPKVNGVDCLNNDINNFRRGVVFDGETTGKLTHVYNFVDDIFMDDRGNLCGDSINLIPCDYVMDEVYLEDIDVKEVGIQIYDEEI